MIDPFGSSGDSIIDPSDSTEPGQSFVADGVGGGVWRHTNDHGGFRYTDLVTGKTITAPTSYALINPAGSAGGLEGFAYNSLGRLTYNGIHDAHAHFVHEVTFKHSTASGEDVFFQVYKNGVATVAEVVQSADSSGFQQFAFHDDVNIVTDDYFEIFVKSASGNVVVHSQYMFAMTMPEGS